MDQLNGEDLGLNGRRLCVVSLDVEADFFNPDTARGAGRLDEVMTILDRHAIRATLFVTGRTLEGDGRLPGYADRHEIATHGYDHQPLEGRDVPARRQELERCIALWRDVLGRHPTGFRAVSHWTDGPQMALLENLGFRYDSSVVPGYPLRGRFWKYPGFRGSAPREPYFVDAENPRKSGGSEVLEIPLTPGPWNLPFSGTWIRLQGPTLYSLLARLTKQPFLHLTFHSWDHIPFPGLWGIRSGSAFLQGLDRILGTLASRFAFVSCDSLLEPP